MVSDPDLCAALPWLDAARNRSRSLLEQLAHRTRAEANPFLCIAVAGSLGRLEAGEGADLDTLFFAAENGSPAAMRADAIQNFFAKVEDLGLALPKPQGIYREALAPHTLLDPAARGRLDETPQIFGARMACLLDARAVHGAEAFGALQRQVLDWYDVAPTLRIEPAWSYLESDLIRYAHAYRNWQRFKRGTDDHDGWALRQAKLHTTRHVTWLGLQALLMQARRQPDGHGRGWLLEHLALNPIERLVTVCREDAPELADLLHALYAAMLARLGAPGVRQALVTLAPARVTAPGEKAPTANEAEGMQIFSGLMDSVDRFRAVLGRWSAVLAAQGRPVSFVR